MVSGAIRERYLRDALPIRLGGLAADLARVASFAENPQNRDAVASLLEESKYFAEWTAFEATLDVQAALAQAQIAVAVWHRRWLLGEPQPDMRREAKQWSERLLTLAGLA